MKTVKKLSCMILTCVLLFTLSGSAFALQNPFKSDWNIKNEDINPSVRTEGILMRSLMPAFSDGFVKLGNFFIDNFLCGMNLAFKVKYEEKYITREDGSKLRLCVYSPKEKKTDVPGLLWIHGGGYALGAPEQDFSFIEAFVLASGCVVVAPDYINSPSAPYPAAFNDCYNSLLCISSNKRRRCFYYI